MSFEFFRKHNKTLLIIAAGSMVLFLVGGILVSGQRTKPNEIPVGTVGSRQIVTGDLRAASGEMTLLRTLLELTYAERQRELRDAEDGSSQKKMMLEQQMRSLADAATVLPGSRDGDTIWVLMLEEADQQGLWASQPEAQSLLTEWGVSPATLAEVNQRLGASEAFLYRALRHYRIVSRLRRLAFTRGYVSEPQLRLLARNTQTRLGVSVIALPADKFLDPAAQPTDEELAKRYNQNRTDRPGTSEPYGFGYRLPPRVAFEYVSLTLDEIEQSVKITEVEANKFYSDNPQLFLPEPEPADQPDGVEAGATGDDGEGGDAAATQPTDEAPAADPAASPDPTQPLPYRQVRDKVYEQVRKARARDLQQQAAQYIHNALTESVRTWKRDDAGFRLPPPPVEWMPLEAVAKGVQEEYGFFPPIRRITPPVALDEVSDTPGIGGAYIAYQGQPVPIAAYMSRAREFKPRGNPFRLQAGVISPPVFDFDGNVYLFRITLADPARPPANLGEVVEQVTEDVRKLKAYGNLKRDAAEYLNMARADGLDTVAASLGEDFAVDQLEPFPRRSLFEDPRTGEYVLNAPNLDKVGQNKPFVDAVFAAAEKIIAAGGIDKVAEEDRYAVFHVDKDLTVYLVQFTAFEPLTADMMALLRPRMAGIAIAAEQRRMLQPGVNPFTVEALKQRLGFIAARDDEPDDEGNGSTDSDSEDSPSPDDA